MYVCTPTKTASPLTYVLQLQCAFSMATPPEQVSTVWSDQHHRGLRTSQSHRMVYHHHARQGLARTRSRTLYFAFDDFPFTVGDRDDQTWC